MLHFSSQLLEIMRRGRPRGMRGGPGRMPPYMRGPPGQKFVVSHSTFDPILVRLSRERVEVSFYQVWLGYFNFLHGRFHIINSSLNFTSFLFVKVHNLIVVHFLKLVGPPSCSMPSQVHTTDEIHHCQIQQ